jgi:hypothetical protein
VVALALVVVSGGQAYYAIGNAPLFMAAGAIVIDGWLARGRQRLRAASLAAAAAISGALVVLLTRPIRSVTDYAKTSLPSDVPDTANEVGWAKFVATVQQVVAALPAA